MSCVLPPLGEDYIECLPNGFTLEHGTSLKLMADASVCINANEEFNSCPTNDWDAWKDKKGLFYLYYATLKNTDTCCCVVRMVLDYGPSTQGQGQEHSVKRLLIDYIRCAEPFRRNGLASYLTDFVLEMCKVLQCNVFVVSTDDSLSFWMKQGFVLEENQLLQNRFNVFSDTTLLKQITNSNDQGEEEDEVEEEEDETDTEDTVVTETDTESDTESDTEDTVVTETDTETDTDTEENTTLQIAIYESLVTSI